MKYHANMLKVKGVMLHINIPDQGKNTRTDAGRYHIYLLNKANKLSLSRLLLQVQADLGPFCLHMLFLSVKFDSGTERSR